MADQLSIGCSGAGTGTAQERSAAFGPHADRARPERPRNARSPSSAPSSLGLPSWSGCEPAGSRPTVRWARLPLVGNQSFPRCRSDINHALLTVAYCCHIYRIEIGRCLRRVPGLSSVHVWGRWDKEHGRGGASGNRASGNQLAPPSVVRCRAALTAIVLAAAVQTGAVGRVGAEVPAGPDGWKVSASYPAIPHGTGIACPSASTCVAVGSNTSGGAAILGTTDGGTTWTAQTPPSGTEGVFGVACQTTSRLLRGRIGHLRGRVDPCHDGRLGRHWVDQTVPPGVGGLDAHRVPGHHGVLRRRVRRHHRYDRTGRPGRRQSAPSGVGGLFGISCSSISRLRRRRIRRRHGVHPGHVRRWCDLDAADRTARVDVRARRRGLSLGGRLLRGRNRPGRRGPPGHDRRHELDQRAHCPRSSADLNGVACTSIDACHAVGFGAGESAVLGTTDGTTWIQQDVPPGSNYPLRHRLPDRPVLRGGRERRLRGERDPRQCGRGVDLDRPAGAAGHPGLRRHRLPVDGRRASRSAPGSGGGFLAATVDGGASWTEPPAPPGVSKLTGISLSGGRHLRGRGQRSGGVVISTSDGATWTTADAAPGR